MPGAEGRTGWPWDAFPWQFNWGFLIIEIAPFLILIGAIIFGALSNRLQIFRPRRGAVVEDYNGVVQENGAFLVPYIVVGLWIVVAIAVLIYTFNNAIFGEQY
jgi:uncharacterized membrane protein